MNISIVVSQFYPELSELLLTDCTNQLISQKIKKESISVYKFGRLNYLSKSKFYHFYNQGAIHLSFVIMRAS